MKMFLVIKNKFFDRFNEIKKYEKSLFVLLISLICFSVFSTIVGQLPSFSNRGITQLFSITWLLPLFPIVFLFFNDYLRTLLKLLFISIPFCLYLGLAASLKIPVFRFQFTTSLILSLFIFSIFATCGKFFNKLHLKLILFSYLIASLIYGFVIYTSKLRGIDISGPMFAVSTKNSTGPILLIGAFCSYYIFEKNNFFYLVIKIAISAFFILIIALMKCRALLISLPFIFLAILYYTIDNFTIKIIIFVLIGLTIIFVVSVPSLNKLLIGDILLNGRTNIDDIFSGRLSQIILGFQNFTPLLGSGNQYVDCMPASLLLSYGFVGLVAVLPILILPFYSIFKEFIKQDKNFKFFTVLLVILFTSETVFEGLGFVGPGARAFIFWLVSGISFSRLDFSFAFKNKKDIKLRFHLNSNKISYSLYSLIFVVSTIASLFVIPDSDIGKNILFKLPDSNIVLDYEKTDGINLKSGYEKICVGQTVKIDFVSNNEKCPDVQGCIKTWNSSQSNYIEVNSENNTIKALSVGNPCFGYSALREKDRVAYLKVVSPLDYDFNNLMVSTSFFYEPFLSNNEGSIVLGEMSYAKIFRDSFYVPSILPDGMSFIFESSNSSIASVDAEGNVFGTHSGECEIYGAIYINSIKKFESNHIPVTVLKSDEYIKVSNIEISAPKTCYQYFPFNIGCLFNENATFTDIVYEINGLPYEMDGNEIVFLDHGNATIIAKSLSNPMITSNELQVNVIENRPVSFTNKVMRLNVGQKYTTSDLNIYLNYTNSPSKLVTNSDLYREPGNFRGRVWDNQNGFVGDNATIYNVKTGSVSLSLISKIDNNVKATFSYQVTNRSESEIEHMSLQLCSIISLVLLLFSSFSVLFIQSRNKWIRPLLYGTNLCISIITLSVVYKAKLIEHVIAIAFNFVFFLLNLLILKNRPLLNICDKKFVVNSNNVKSFFKVEL